MKKNSIKKLELKKNIVASLSKSQMTMMGGGLTAECLRSDLCASGKVLCYVHDHIYSNQSCTQFCN